MNDPRGFALLAVLWLVVALVGLSAGTLAHVRVGSEHTAQRVALLRGRWAAEGCLAVALATLAESRRVERELRAPAVEPLRFTNSAECDVVSRDPNASHDPVYGNDRINVNGAPDSLVIALPGFGPEALRVLTQARAWRRPIRSLEALAHELEASARTSLLLYYAELLPQLEFQTASLVLTARGWVPGVAATAHAEVHVVAPDGRVAVLRRRLW